MRSCTTYRILNISSVRLHEARQVLSTRLASGWSKARQLLLTAYHVHIPDNEVQEGPHKKAEGVEIIERVLPRNGNLLRWDENSGARGLCSAKSSEPLVSLAH